MGCREEAATVEAQGDDFEGLESLVRRGKAGRTTETRRESGRIYI